MQRTKIKIGETYGVVVRHRSRNNSPQPATVVGFDGEYEVSRSYGFHNKDVTHNDGIRIVFAEDMRIGHDYFEPWAACKKRMNDRAIASMLSEGNVLKAGQEFVLKSAKSVLEPWAAIAERAAADEEAAREWREKNDEAGDEIEPKLRKVIEEMNRRGLFVGDAYSASVKCVRDTGKGMTADRTTGATFKIKLDALAELLGIEA